MENNPELAVVRYEPGASDARVAAAQRGVPADASRAASTATAPRRRRQPVLRRAGIADRLLVGRRRPGPAAAVGRRQLQRRLDSLRTTTDNPFTNFNPSLTSALQAIVLAAAAARFQDRSATAQVEIDAAQPRHRRHPGSGSAARRSPQAPRRAYWALVAALASVDVQQRSLDLAQELERNNRARVDVGQSPPLDLVAARAEVAQRQENLIIARTTALQAEDLLRTLIVDPKRTDYWSVRIRSRGTATRGGRGARRRRSGAARARRAVRHRTGPQADREHRHQRRAREEPDASRPARCRRPISPTGRADRG